MKIISIFLALFFLLFFAKVEANDSDLILQLEALKKKYQAIEEGEILTKPIGKKESDDLSTNQNIGIPVGEELVLSLYVDNIFLGDIFAEKSSASAKLGLSALLTLIDFPIFFSNDLTSANGWFFEESNIFELKGNRDTITVFIKDIEQPLSKESYIVRTDDDIYIESDDIANWFGLNFDYNFRRLSINLSSNQLLPIQQQLARKAKKTYGKQESSQPSLPLKNNPYQLYTLPVADLQITANTNENNTNTSYSLIGSNDLAYFNAQYSLNGTTSSDGLTDLRLNLSKRSSEADLLGPLDATTVEFGDIQSTRIGLNNSSSLSRGIRITNKTLSTRSNESNIDISGDIQPEWDIELYRNGVLIDNQFSLPTNRYEFTDVDLLYGNNLFELIFYGPQGQVLKETKQYYINNDFFEKKGNFDISLTDKGESLFGVNKITSQDSESGIELAGVYNRGLTDWLSAYVGGSSLLDKSNSLTTPKHQYSLGTDITLFNRILLGIDYIEDSNKENTIEYSGRTVLSKQSVNISYKKDSIVNTENTTDSTLKNEEFKLSLAGRLPFTKSLGYQQSFEQTVSDNGSKTNTITNDLSFNIGGTSLNHGLQWDSVESQVETTDELSGSIRSRHTLKNTFIRNQLDYSIHPEVKADRFQTEATTIISEDVDVKLSYATQLETNDNEYGASATWKPKEAVLTSSFLYNDTSGWKLNLIARLSIGQKDTDTSNIFFLTKNSLTNRGALLVRVFEDINANGVFDPEEPPLSGVKVKSVQTYQSAITDTQGIAILTSMKTHNRTDITIDTGTLPDPYLKPLTQGVSISPRKGTVGSYDIPVVQTSEIEGIVYIGKLNGSKLATYADMHLKNAQNEIVATTTTEYDGYYLFTDVLPGDYTLSIDQDYVDKRNLNNTDPKNLTFSSTSTIANGIDFVLGEKRNITGYVTQLGTFSSTDTLNAFWTLLGRKYPALKTSETAYYDRIDNKLFLYSAFFTDQDKANQECERLMQNNIQCEVQEKSLS